nr:MAG TPA: hypothetical protein [Caudoviricetes sp.]
MLYNDVAAIIAETPLSEGSVLCCLNGYAHTISHFMEIFKGFYLFFSRL